MSRFRQYTDRVTLQSDGCYCWRQDTERKYELSRLKTGFTACTIIAVFILAFGVFLSIFNGTFNGTPINYTLNDIPASIYVFVLCAAVFMLISILVFGLSTLLVDSPGEIYTMCDTFIQTGEGQSSEYFYFKKAKKVTLTPRYIKLKGRFGTMRVYVSPKDMSFVRNYILSRVSGDADIVYV